MARMTKTQRIAQQRLSRYLFEDNREKVIDRALRRSVPDAWHTLERDLETDEPKVKVTLWLDASVARLFRGMGRGYQARINRILATWCQLKIAGVLAEDRALEKAVRDWKGGGTAED